MSDAGAAAATGIVAVPFLAAMGIDPQSMVAGLIGVVVVQSLMPADGRTLRGTIIITLGSVLFASLAGPLLTPWVLHQMKDTLLPHEGVRAACAAAAGAFAQPVVVLLKNNIVPSIMSRLRAAIGAKEET